MARNDMDNNLEEVRRKDKERRTSVLPAEAAYADDDIPDAWSIANTTQLAHWVKRYPDQVMAMLTEIRFERDQFLAVAVLYGPAKEAKSVVDQELAEIKHDLAKSETKVEKLKKQLRAMQDNEEEAKTDSAPLVRKEKSTKFPDPPIFTDGVDPTWDDWSYKVAAKLRANSDHYPVEQNKIDYVISRLGGKASTHTKIRKLPDGPNPYTAWKDVLEHLSSTFEETNAAQIAKVQLDALVMGNSTFREFYGELMRLGNELGKSDHNLRELLIDKVTPKWADRVRSSHHWAHGSLREIKDYLILLDDAFHAEKAKQALQKAAIRPVATAIAAKSSPYVASAKRATPIAKTIVTANVKKEPSDETLICFGCGEEGHTRRNCKHPIQTPAGKKAVLEAKIQAIDNGDDVDIDNIGNEDIDDSGNE